MKFEQSEKVKKQHNLILILKFYNDQDEEQAHYL